MSSYNLSICDSSCKNLFHYFTPYNSRSAEVLEALADRHGISMDGQGMFLARDEIIKAINTVVEIVGNSAAYKYRVTKLKLYLEHVVVPADKGEEFYIHFTV